MHSIERYGIVALLFLVVTVVAVLMWDGEKSKKAKSSDSAAVPAAPASTAPRLDEELRNAELEKETAPRRLSLMAESQPGPLRRNSPAEPEEESTAETQGSLAEPLQADHAPEGEALRSDTAPAPEREDASADPSAERPARDFVVGQASATGAHTYTVRAGDTLSEIAQRELGSARRWPEIVAANPGLDPVKLRLGKKIQVPGTGPGAGRAAEGALSQRAPEKKAAAEASSSRATWKVAKGENLWKIAERALGDGQRWREIAKLNPRADPEKLVLGQVLALPNGALAGKAAPERSGREVASKTSKPKSASSPKNASPTLVASRAGSDNASQRGARVK